MHCRVVVLVVLGLLAGASRAQSDAPLLTMDDLRYAGAVRLPASMFGDSSLNYSEGPIEYLASSHSLLIVGHSHHQQIAEFALPALVNSATLADLNMAGDPLQLFSPVLSRMSSNPDGLNRIGGMEVLATAEGERLLVNAYEYYDAPGDNVDTSLMVERPDDIAGGAVLGPKRFQGGAGHTSGWMSPLASEWQAALGGDTITGQSSGIPIISRTSVGPSAFAFQAASLTDTTDTIATTRLMDFSLANPLHADLSNDSGDNDLWTHLSRAVFGVVVPGTRTYLTVGSSGGHESGVCYKCEQDNGNLCGGYCPRRASDQGSYYWLWDLNDLVDARNGLIEPHAIRPYAYGEWVFPFSDHAIGGGSYDPASGLLYLSLPGADTEQGTYSNPPVIVVFEVNPALFKDRFETAATP